MAPRIEEIGQYQQWRGELGRLRLLILEMKAADRSFHDNFGGRRRQAALAEFGRQWHRR
jgi:hypothetical protein